jgi:hypothetical protein
MDARFSLVIGMCLATLPHLVGTKTRVQYSSAEKISQSDPSRLDNGFAFFLEPAVLTKIQNIEDPSVQKQFYRVIISFMTHIQGVSRPNDG